MSRALRELSRQLVTLGRGKNTRYGLPQSIRGLPAQQPLWWTDVQGNVSRFGTLTLLAGERLHVAADGIDGAGTRALALVSRTVAPARFLGRKWTQRLALEGNPEQWKLEQILYAALHIDDHPGAISIGEPQATLVPVEPIDVAARGARYDALAAGVSATLPAGSSAGGEQSKFLAPPGFGPEG